MENVATRDFTNLTDVNHKLFQTNGTRIIIPPIYNFFSHFHICLYWEKLQSAIRQRCFVQISKADSGTTIGVSLDIKESVAKYLNA